jgi:hypothetical protein
MLRKSILAVFFLFAFVRFKKEIGQKILSFNLLGLIKALKDLPNFSGEALRYCENRRDIRSYVILVFNHTSCTVIP